MRVFTLGSDRSIERFGSVGAMAGPVARAVERGQLVRIELAPGGVLGRHEAVADQLFIVVGGDGTVTGGDEIEAPIHAGMAAFWNAGELHQTRAGENGLVALVLEGHFTLPDAERRG
ncbi:MAG: cupin domain-containing protein [Dehalococcoidia bacterium]